MEDAQKAVQPHFQPGLFPDLPKRRFLIGFIHLQQSADQAPLTVVRPTLEEYLVIPDNQCAGAVQDQLARANDLSQLMYVVHITRPPSY